IGERAAERDDALGGVERIGACVWDVVWLAVLRVPVEVGVVPGGVVVDVPGLVAVAHQVGPRGGVQEQGAIARRLAAVGGTERGEVGERRPVQQQLDGTGAGARGHVLPRDRGDGAVARGVPPRGRRQREQGGGDEGGAAHTRMIESSAADWQDSTAPSCDGRGVAAASFHCRSERNHAGSGRVARESARLTLGASPGITETQEPVRGIRALRGRARPGVRPIEGAPNAELGLSARGYTRSGPSRLWPTEKLESSTLPARLTPGASPGITQGREWGIM